MWLFEPMVSTFQVTLLPPFWKTEEATNKMRKPEQQNKIQKIIMTRQLYK